MSLSKPLHVSACLGVCALLCTSLASAQLRVGEPTRTDAGPGAAASVELSQASSFAFPLVGLNGANDYRNPVFSSSTWFNYTMDGGANWQEVLISPPMSSLDENEGDAMTCADPRSGLIWAGGITFSGSGGPYAARFDPIAETFSDAVMIEVSATADKG